MNECKHIDIALDKQKEIVFSGIELYSNDEILVFINFNEESAEYDGYSVFRIKDIYAYSEWTQEDFDEVKKDNSWYFKNKLKINGEQSFKSILKRSSDLGLIAFFTDIADEDYYVGKLNSIKGDEVVFNLIDEDKDWMGIKKINIDEICYFGFATTYEIELMS
jgi:hypothetical protein